MDRLRHDQTRYTNFALPSFFNCDAYLGVNIYPGWIDRGSGGIHQDWIEKLGIWTEAKINRGAANDGHLGLPCKVIRRCIYSRVVRKQALSDLTR